MPKSRHKHVVPTQLEEKKRVHTWTLRAKKYKPVPCSGQKTNQAMAYCIVLHNIRNLPVPEPLQEMDPPHFSIRVSLFDLGTRQFFGNTWCSPENPFARQSNKRRPHCRIAATGNLETPSLDIPLYLHTMVNDPSCVAVIEYILADVDNGSGTTVHSYGIGWTVMPLFGLGKGGQDGRRQNLRIYGGSPRSLILLPPGVHRLEDARESLEPLHNASLVVQVLDYTPMLTCTHLIPKNIIVSNHEIIPGIGGRRGGLPAKPLLQDKPSRRSRRDRNKNKKDSTKGALEMRPIRLLRRSTLKVSGIKVLMPFGFEERFQDDVTAIAEQSLEASERVSWTIRERWLDFAVHNSLQVVPGSTGGQATGDGSASGDARGWIRVPLVVGEDCKDPDVDGFFLREKNKETVRLEHFVAHPSVALIAMLCYKVERNVGSRSRRRRKKKRRDTDVDDDETGEPTVVQTEAVFQVAVVVFLPTLTDGTLRMDGYFDCMEKQDARTVAMTKTASDFDAKKGDTKRPLEMWMPPPEQNFNLDPARHIYDGWQGNGRVIMLGMRLRGRRRARHGSDSSSGEEGGSSSSSGRGTSSESDSDDSRRHDSDSDLSEGGLADEDRRPKWLYKGAKIEVRLKRKKEDSTIRLHDSKHEWVPATVTKISRRNGIKASSAHC